MRVCDIVAQVASALDAAHAHGLVHRDVKPGNMLREATSGRAHSDHVYLSDFGLSKHSLSVSALTSAGQFLGTLNTSRRSRWRAGGDGRTDEYALACSAFEMLAGQPPFRREESLAIMWAQLSSAPPSLTGMRPDLPAALDAVMARALAKAPGDRYGSCLDFASALRRACGFDPGGTDPGAPGRGATRAVRPAELAAAAAAASAADPADTGRADRRRADTGRADTSRGRGMPTEARSSRAPGRPSGGSPTRGRLRPPVPVRGSATAGTPAAPPLGPPGRHHVAGPGVRSPSSPPRASSWPAPATYLLLGRNAGGGSGGGPTSTTRVLTLPGCTTKTAPSSRLPHVRTHFVQVGGKPFDVVVTPNHFGFVSLRKGAPLVVMNTARFVPTVVQNVPLGNPEGEAFTHNQRYLLVAGDSGMTVFRVSDLESGLTTPVGSLSSPGGKGAIEVVTSPDDRFAFVTLQNSGNVAVFNLKKALSAGFGPADFVGMIPMSSDPVGITASPDGRYLYVVSGLAGVALQSGMGTLAVVDMHKAESSPGTSVVTVRNAGCGPARVITSADGKDVWVTAGGGNALEAFSAANLLSDPKHALIARVAVGEIPLGLAFIKNGTRMVVADSNRDNIGGVAPGLAVINVSKALAGEPALVGTIKSGGAPRQFALEPNGKTLLVTNTNSGQVEAVDVGRLP